MLGIDEEFGQLAALYFDAKLFELLSREEERMMRREMRRAERKWRWRKRQL